jgi:hypothetical protein
VSAVVESFTAPSGTSEAPCFSVEINPESFGGRSIFEIQLHQINLHAEMSFDREKLDYLGLSVSQFTYYEVTFS